MTTVHSASVSDPAVTGLLQLQGIVVPDGHAGRRHRSAGVLPSTYTDIRDVEKRIASEKRAFHQMTGLFDDGPYRDHSEIDDGSSSDSEHEMVVPEGSPTHSSSKKTLFLQNEPGYVALNTGFPVRGAPEVFASYVGAPCPICYEDLGKKVPKDTDFRRLFTTVTTNKVQVNTQIKEMKSGCAAHSAEVHPKFPIWNCFRTQDLRPTTHMRKKNLEITAAGLLYNALKGAYDGVPIEKFFPITPESILMLCMCRLSYASCHVSYNSGNYFRGKSGLKTNADFQMDVVELIDKIRTQFREHYDYAEIATMIHQYSLDQIIGVCNLFFVEMDYYLICPSWFYKHEQQPKPNIMDISI
jgi:hypothetical protein